MSGAGTVTGREATVLAECRREIRRLHGCSAEFERFVTVPEAPGRARRVVAVFLLHGHPARRCYAWPDRGEGGTAFVAVLHGIDIRGPEDAVQHVSAIERASRERWAQEYA